MKKRLKKPNVASRTKRIMMVFDSPAEALRICPTIKKLECIENVVPIIVISEQLEKAQVMQDILELFQVKVHYTLPITTDEQQNLNQLTGWALNDLTEIVKHEKIVSTFVCGNSRIAFAATLSSYYNGIPVTQIKGPTGCQEDESSFLGSRSKDLIGSLAKQEMILGLEESLQIIVTKYDNLFLAEESVYKKIILVDYHGKTNHKKVLKKIFQALKQVIDIHKEVIVVIPIKLTATIMELANEILKGQQQIYFVQPFHILEKQQFVHRAWLIITDSSDCLEVAEALRTPVLVVQETAVKAVSGSHGPSVFIGLSKIQIVDWLTRLLTEATFYEKIAVRKLANKEKYTTDQIIQSFASKE
ncbi:hypothetical protein HCB27_04980 [Listeria booriae]|uniref:UDP-N-acetylglucosamine 2-epimerase domain-containing protein n=1 Tax=Listeria booriae TaxID=1552123 RepID=A0A7X1D7U8_9LIST|nr:UDP-N-acetylglucosamine 2-epimerase [Listeria booriae]MBC2175958.1 hypothetical protein [Listeria booriae]